MRELTLEHLAPYLSYKLKGIFTELPGEMPFEAMGITIDNEDDTELVKVHGCPGRLGGQVSEISNFKPILRPLSDLIIDKPTENIQHLAEIACKQIWGESPNWLGDVKLVSENNNYGLIGFDLDGARVGFSIDFDCQMDFKLTIDSGNMMLNKLELFNKLFEWHYDLYELIDSDLAIDINTISHE